MSKETVSIICSGCGSKGFEYPANPKPNDTVTCNGCGAQATYATILEAAEKQVIDGIKKDFGDLFD